MGDLLDVRDEVSLVREKLEGVAVLLRTAAEGDDCCIELSRALWVLNGSVLSYVADLRASTAKLDDLMAAQKT